MNESCRLDLGAQSWPGSVVQVAAGAPKDVMWAPWKVDYW